MKKLNLKNIENIILKKIKKIKIAASKFAIIQYRMLPEDFFAQRKGFAAWQ